MAASGVLGGVSRLVGLLLLFTGCGLDPEGGLLSAEAKQLVRDHEDSAEVLSSGAAIAALPALVLSSSTVTLSDAVAAQSNVADRLEPPGCASITTSGNRVTYTLVGCSGPWGRVQVTGTEVATFSPGDVQGSFVIELASEDDLVVNGSPAVHEATAIVTFTGESRTIDWNGRFEGSTKDGRAVRHEADVALVLSGGAVSLSGSSSVQVGLRNLEVDVPSLERNGPLGTCPEGTVHIQRKLGGLEVTLTFDGTAEYVAKTSRGGRGTFDLSCTPPEGG
jgi:hypothetical protein